MLRLLRKLNSKTFGRIPEPLAFPPPYQGMLSISSDVEFTSWDAQLDLVELFASRGLECGFSYWCYGDEQVTWRLFDEDGTPAPYAEAASHLIRAGMLDTLHSFGGVTDGRGARFDRAAMERALDWMSARGLRSRVYSNHGTRLDIQNVGGEWAEYQEGDVPGSPAYHLDLTTAFGVRFVWTDIDYDNQNPYFQLRGPAARRLLIPQKGRDGTPILRFRRYRGAFNRAPYAGNVGEQIANVLAHEPSGYSIVYQHLGVQRLPDGTPIPTTTPYFDAAGLAALERLADLDARGVLLVTSTERLLMHAVLMQAKPWRIEQSGERISVHFQRDFRYEQVHFELNFSDLNGWCLPIRPGQKVIAHLGEAEWELPTIKVCDELFGSIPWERRPLLDILKEAKGVDGHETA